tara:strand:- start:351 stop:977 length:627 start_codon:yes stop_codon:yes gene_type:complete
MINLIKQFIFIHIPKTGGSTIKSYLRSFRGNTNVIMHPHILDYINKLPESSDFFKFTSVRNPWELVVSRYFYRLKLIENAKENRRVKDAEVTFDEFVKNEEIFMNSFKSWVSPKSEAFKMYDKGKSFGSQYDLLSDSNGKMLMDKVIKYENFENELNNLLVAMGIITYDKFHINKSDHADYQMYYDQETRKIIADRFVKDIDYFKYSF